MHMSDAAIRLKQAREAAGFENATEAAKRFRWTVPTYLAHENGSRGIRSEAAQIYGARFRVAPEWILFGDGPQATSLPGFTESEASFSTADLVPVYNISASAGGGALIDWEEAVVERLAFPPDYLRKITSSHPRHLAIIGVKGDSMTPTLSDNDVVMIDTSKTDLSFDGLFVLKDGGASLLVKRVGRGSRSGTVTLISDNRTYRDTERAVEDIEVVGKVVWRGVKE